jgi:tryptophan 2,3-dioxygenase
MLQEQIVRNLQLAIDTMRAGRTDAAVRILERVMDVFEQPVEFNITDDALARWLS